MFSDEIPRERLTWYSFKTTLVLIGLSWCTWWFWTFTVSHIINPIKPKTLPYLIPWFGHIAAFVSDGNGLITKGRNTRRPFALVLGGQYVYIVTSAKDTTTIFRNLTQLTFDGYVEDMQLRFGASPLAVKAMWAKPKLDYLRKQQESGGFPNPQGKSLAHLSEAIFKAQLLPGANLDALSRRFLSIIIDQSKWDSTPDQIILKKNPGDTWRVVSLHRWTRHMLLYAATKSFFGEALFRLDPNILDHFAIFDEDSWQFTYQVPALFAQRTYKAKAAAQIVFDKYFELPASERSDASWMVLTLESEMRATGTKSGDVSAYLLMLYWVINSNAWKAAYWLCSHILFDPELKASIEEDLRPFFQNNLSPDPVALMEVLESLPYLVAAYNEALRVCTSSVTVRNVLEDCMIGGARLQKGSRIIVPFRQMMMDEEVFGEHPEEFRPQRFLERPSLAKDPSFRPFGGGVTYCPGRVMAQKEVLMVVASLFGKYKATLGDTEQSFPRMETKKPCLGIMGPAAGEDLELTVFIGHVNHSIATK